MDFLVLTFQRNFAADGVIYEMQVTQDLVSWSSLDPTLVSSTSHGDGTGTVTQERLRNHSGSGTEIPNFIKTSLKYS